MDFRAKLEDWARSRPDDQARAARALAGLFDTEDRRAVSRIIGEIDCRLSKLPREITAGAPALLAQFLSELPPRQKRSASKDIHTLRTALTTLSDRNLLPDSEVSRLSPASDGKPMGKRAKIVNNELVDEYVRLLESVLKEPEAFLETYTRLAEDKRVRQPEAALIARKFFGHAPANTPRKDALRLIKERHISLEDHRAKTRAQAGKSAA